MEVSIFDHLDRNTATGGGSLTDYYETRLSMIERYEAAGFRAYHQAEHHATPLGMSPSPSVFLSAVVQRTKRLRFGPLVYCVPFYHPVRLMEEICMLDQMSGGRLELGVGPGISPIEASYYGLDTSEMQGRYREAFALIMKGLSGDVEDGRLNFEGEHFQVKDMPLEMSPLQSPHPPLWCGTANPESAVWAAENNVNLITNVDAAMTRAVTDRYREVWDGLGHSKASLPFIGMTRHIVVADTDEAAMESAERAFQRWRSSFLKLWLDHGRDPINVNMSDNFTQHMERGMGYAGTPERVRDLLLADAEACGSNYLLARFVFGDLSETVAARSVDLFAEHVLPALSALKATA
jgi:alkanesulfonate monooxygenase SsuD/methylene tetrahydromethanopterin reductase-like flavin-dependent oxidoreductase (luciferase family)